ncbi:MAG: UDP-N-acetylglucosamine--N-acetylmuramyl-(pentapeptide) pyrophosphoryl-undecaprenol N-acetylglucosamine transferase [Candidatus Omnitrophota bacterium]
MEPGTSKPIVVLTGPTGGHLFASIAFAEAYHAAHSGGSLTLVTGARARDFLAARETAVFDRIVFLDDFPMPRRLDWRSGVFIFQLMAAFVRMLSCFLKRRPRLVIGFGSYIAFPGIVAAFLLRIPRMIHEQNYIPGKATRMSSRFVPKIAVSFEGTRDYFPASQTVQTGFPLRQALRETGPRVIRTGKPFRLMVLGGSQGAGKINAWVLEGFSTLSLRERADLAVIHITGREDHEKVRSGYADLGISASVFPFHSRIEECFEASDLVITRAGAGTLFELAAFGAPAVVIPYPYAEDHQRKNAEFFSKKDALILCDEKDMNGDKMTALIRRLRDQPDLRESLSRRIVSFHVPDAAERLVGLADRVMGRMDL